MDGIIGEIRLWANTFAPHGWALCEGQSLPITQYPALFTVLGITYGGDGIRTFTLPDLRGRAAIGAGTGLGLTTRALGDAVGSATVALTEDELPMHRHTVGACSAAAAVGSPVGATPATSESIKPYANSANGTMAATAVGLAGSGEAHDNMQPYLAMRYIICLNGLYPTHW
jgi:microcystin-dependent protein